MLSTPLNKFNEIEASKKRSKRPDMSSHKKYLAGRERAVCQTSVDTRVDLNKTEHSVDNEHVKVTSDGKKRRKDTLARLREAMVSGRQIIEQTTTKDV